MLITMMMMVNDSDYIDLLGSARAANLQANHLWAHSALVVPQIQKQLQTTQIETQAQM